MKFLTLILFLFSVLLLASEKIPNCSKNELVLNGIYSDKLHESEVLSNWSMEAGNLTRLKVLSKVQYKKIKLSFVNDQKVIFENNLNLVKNQTSKFDFLEMLSKKANGARLISFVVFNNLDKAECQYQTEILVNDSEQVEKQINVIKKN